MICQTRDRQWPPIATPRTVGEGCEFGELHGRVLRSQAAYFVFLQLRQTLSLSWGHFSVFCILRHFAEWCMMDDGIVEIGWGPRVPFVKYLPYTLDLSAISGISVPGSLRDNTYLVSDSRGLRRWSFEVSHLFYTVFLYVWKYLRLYMRFTVIIGYGTPI